MAKLENTVVSWSELERSEDGQRVLHTALVNGKKTGYVEERLDADGSQICAFALGTVKKVATALFKSPGPDLTFMIPAVAKSSLPQVDKDQRKGAVPSKVADFRRTKATKPALALGESSVGKLKFFNHDKGYGFFEVSGYADVFLCFAGVPEELEEELTPGSEFCFTVVKDTKHNKLMACITSEAVAQRQAA